MNEIREYDYTTVEDEHQAFEITDLNTLGWAFRKIAEYQKKEREIVETAKAEVERIVSWQDKEVGKISDSIDFFQSHIERYHFKRLLDDPKAKTLSTPYGKSKSRVSKPQPERVDENALLEHIKANQLDEFIKLSTDWGNFKKSINVVQLEDGEFVAVDGIGEIIPGIIIKPEETRFSLEVAE